MDVDRVVIIHGGSRASSRRRNRWLIASRPLESIVAPITKGGRGEGGQGSRLSIVNCTVQKTMHPPLARDETGEKRSVLFGINRSATFPMFAGLSPNVRKTQPEREEEKDVGKEGQGRRRRSEEEKLVALKKVGEPRSNYSDDSN